MSFVGSMLSNDRGSGYRAQGAAVASPVRLDQAEAGRVNAEGAIDQQQAFVNALNGVGGINNQQSVFGQQQALANQLQNVANGTGPNPAMDQLNQTTGRNVANQAALMAGQRGAGTNAGLMARLAAQQGANTQQQAVGQGATLAAQQQLAGMGMLQGQQANMGNMANTQIGQQQTGLSQLNQARQNEQQMMYNAITGQNNANVGMQSNLNNANAGIAGINAQGQQAILGGLMNGIGGGMASMFGMNQGGMVKGYDDGGLVAPQPQYQVAAPQIQSGAGQILTQSEGTSPINIGSVNMPADSGAEALKEGIGGKKGSGGGGGMMGMLALLNKGGNVGDSLKSGGKVPGQAKAPGDNPANDTVSAKLSPQEIVIPRSIAMHPDAPELAKQFVIETLEKQVASKKNYDDGGWTGNNSDLGLMADVPDQQVSQPQVNSPPMSLADTTRSSAVMSMDQANNQMPAPPQPTSLSTQPQNNDPYGYGVQGDMLNSAYQHEKAGIRGEAAAVGDQGKREASDLEANQSKLQSFQNNFNDEYKKLDTERRNVVDEIRNQKIDPNKYVADMSTQQKVGTAIGLILGGIGGGLTHQENPAMKFLDHQIENNIKSQQMNMDKGMNLLKANMMQFGNLKDATDMMRLTQADLIVNQLKTEAAKTADPMAKARALKAVGELESRYAPLQQQMAIRRTLSQGTQGPTSQQIDPQSKIRLMEMSGMMPKEDGHKATEELGHAMEIEKLRDDVERNAKDLQKSFVGGRLTPGYRASKIAPLSGVLAKMAAGRFNLEESNTQMSGMMPEGGDSAATIASKAQAREQFFTAMKNTPTLLKYQIKVPRLQGLDIGAPVKK